MGIRTVSCFFVTTLSRVAATTAVLSIVVVGCGGGSASRTGPKGEVTVFAAASLRDAVDAIADAFEKSTGTKVVRNYAGSNTLAQQIRATSSADVFLSASERWMDDVEKGGRVVSGTRRTILSNRLVVIVKTDSRLDIHDPASLVAAKYEHLSLADPEAVPAGRYAKTWLESLAMDGRTAWDALSGRVAPAPDVRAALGLVESDPRVPGIVYRTDAMASDRVRVAYEVPAAAAPKIRYAAARIEGGANPDAGAVFLEFLRGKEATAIFERLGFLTVHGDAAASNE